MIIHLQNYPGDMKRIWFQLSVDNSNFEIDNYLLESEFDIVLNDYNKDQGIYDWVLGFLLLVSK